MSDSTWLVQAGRQGRLMARSMVGSSSYQVALAVGGVDVVGGAPGGRRRISRAAGFDKAQLVKHAVGGFVSGDYFQVNGSQLA